MEIIGGERLRGPSLPNLPPAREARVYPAAHFDFEELQSYSRISMRQSGSPRSGKKRCFHA